VRHRMFVVALVAGLLTAGCSSGSGEGKAVAGPATGPVPSGPAPEGYAPWPEAERDATHTSQAALRGPQTGHIRWKVDLGSPISPGPSVGADGTIYESSDAGVLYALDPATGHEVWRFDGAGAMGGNDTSTTAAVLPDGAIVWPGPRDTVFGLSAQGKLLWTVDVGGVPLSPVIASPTTVYVMTTSGVLTAIEVDGAKSGVRWTLKLGAQSYADPVVRGDGVIETTVDDSLVAVHDDGDGAHELWTFTAPAQVEVSAAIAVDGTAVIGADDGFEYAISASGKQLWKHRDISQSFSSPAVTSDGTAYFGDNGGAMTSVSAATGVVARTVNAHPGVSTAGDNIWTAPLIDGIGDVYYGTNGGTIYGYSPSGSQLFAIQTGKTVDSYPALSADGDLLIGSDNGYLYSIGS
jgi:outer membrane protein assembly factor BamB